MKFSKRTQSIETSATLAMSATARRMKLRGIDVADLSIGQPDFKPPEEATRAIIDYINKGYFGYLPPQGLIELRRAVAAHIQQVFGLVVGPSHVLITTGAKQAIALAFQVLVEEGDEVLIPTPAWVSYSQLVSLTGATPVFVPTKFEEGFSVKASLIERYITARTKAIIINSPNNPTGQIIPPDELKRIAKLIENYGLTLISDDIYASLNFSSQKVDSIIKYVKNQDNVISIGGISKTYGMPGLRLGWAVGGLKIIEKMRDVLSQTVSCVSGPSQAAAIAAMKGDQSFLHEIKEIYSRRAQYVCQRLKHIQGVELIEPKGTFYVLASFKPYIGMRYQGQLIRNSTDLAMFLLNEAHVAVAPGEAFHAPNFLRISYATSDDVIKKGLDRIEEFLSVLTR